MAGFDDARDLIVHAATDLAKIRKDYEQALHAQNISASLRVDIKNFFENLRSALDFAGCRYARRHPRSDRRRVPLGCRY
jgi:hypothetical protein